MTQEPVILGAQLWFARAETGVSTPSLLPEANSAAWKYLGIVKDCAVDRASEDVELYRPYPGALQLAAVVPIKASLTYAFTISDLGPQGVEFLWGTEALTGSSTEFTPLNTLGAINGWLKSQFYSHTNMLKIITDTWVMLKPTQGLKADGNSFAEIAFEARVLANSLNKGGVS